jgi:hypothetical protein
MLKHRRAEPLLRTPPPLSHRAQAPSDRTAKYGSRLVARVHQFRTDHAPTGTRARDADIPVPIWVKFRLADHLDGIVDKRYAVDRG